MVEHIGATLAVDDLVRIDTRAERKRRSGARNARPDAGRS